jgi:hypothetical protein
VAVASTVVAVFRTPVRHRSAAAAVFRTLAPTSRSYSGGGYHYGGYHGGYGGGYHYGGYGGYHYGGCYGGGFAAGAVTGAAVGAAATATAAYYNQYPAGVYYRPAY